MTKDQAIAEMLTQARKARTEVHLTQKAQAIAEILELMEQYGLTLEDIFEPETKVRDYELTTTNLLPR